MQRPVHVSDVAWAVVQALESPVTIGRQFNISGAAPLTYNDVVRLIPRPWVVGFSASTSQPGQSLLHFRSQERLGITMPIKAEQLLRLNEDKAFSHAEAADAFGYSPITLSRASPGNCVVALGGNSLCI